jgi:transposase
MTRFRTHYFPVSDNTILIRFWKRIGIMRRNLFWLSDEQWARIEPHLPTDVRGVERVNDRRVISGIVHVLKSGCRWCDCPPEYGPPTTIYNRFVRWARRGLWENLFRELAGCGRSVPNHPNRKHLLSFNKRLYKLRWRIETAFNRLKDFRRIATRYDRLARNYLASICLAASLVWRL